MEPSSLFLGTAGWAIPAKDAASFPGSGSHLERYARRFNAAEINSTFHRPHRRSTVERWAASVPDDFRFAVKMPKAVTHERRLADVADLVDAFFAMLAGLGSKLGPALAQLPPSLAFDPASASPFVSSVRACFGGALVCEPRHPTWFTPEADAFLAEHRVARAAADPPVVPAAERPGGWTGLVYYRLHGSPRRYYSAYAPDRLEEYAAPLRSGSAKSATRWCIFDNTAGQNATLDAMSMAEALRAGAHSEGRPRRLSPPSSPEPCGTARRSRTAS